MKPIFKRSILTVLFVFCLALCSQFFIPASPNVALAASEAESTYTGWVSKDGKRYYYEGGKMAKGWKTIGKRTYYLQKDGSAATGFKKIGKNWYYFSTSRGIMRTGWKTVNGKKYYLGDDGKARTGWQNIDGSRYYFSTGRGIMRTGWKTINGKTYYLGDDGKARTGWQTIKGSKYYFSKNKGILRTGWKTINGTPYYFDEKSGKLLYTGPSISSISSDCAVLVNADTGEVVFNKNGSSTHANASTTKILTCILALEMTDLNDVVTASANAASQEPSKIYLHSGEKFYMKDLLYAMMLPSGNDAAVAVAEHISGSTSAFATLMNQKAKEIGCTSTHFVTPNGLDAGMDHYTTALDLAKIARYAYQNSTFRKIIKTTSYSFTSISGYSYHLNTTNELLGSMAGVAGMKTGYTNKAGYCFVGVVKSKGGQTYISVTLGASSSSARWEDSRTLLNFAYNLK